MDLKKWSIKLSLVKILEIVLVFIEILIKILLFKGGALIHVEHCTYAAIIYPPELYIRHIMIYVQTVTARVNEEMSMEAEVAQE